jgi:hypothetical protein
MAIRKYTKKSRKYKRKHKSLKLQKGGNGNNIKNGNNKYVQPNPIFDTKRTQRQKELLKKSKLTYKQYEELFPPDKYLYMQGSDFGDSFDNVAYTNEFHRMGK